MGQIEVPIVAVDLSIQVPVKAPAPLLMKPTEPVGVEIGTGEVSLTVAVHETSIFTLTRGEEQLTVVTVERPNGVVTIRVNWL